MLLTCLLCTAALQGQADFAVAPTCPATQTEYLRHYAAGSGLPMNLVISPPATVPGAISWGFITSGSTGGNCASTFSAAGNGQVENIGGNLRATFNSSGVNRNVTISSSGALIAGEYNLTLRLTGGGNSYVRNYRFIVRRPVDIVFALDRSGSMECDTDENVPSEWPGCITHAAADDGRRWDLMASAIDNFVGNLDFLHVLPTDRLSVVYFDGNTATPSTLVSDAVPFSTVANFRGTGSPTAIKLELDNMAAPGTPLGRNGTSLGAGLYKAISGRYGSTEDVNRRQIVLLFTDGEQNTGQWVKSAGPGMGRRILSSSSSASTDLNLDAAEVNDIEVLTAGTLYTGSSPALLQAIAGGTSGYFNVLPGMESQFGSDLAGHAFNEIYNTASPRFIASAQYPLRAEGPELRTDFTVNRNVNRLIFQVFFNNPIAGRTKLRVYRDGLDVSGQGQFRSNSYSTTLSFPLYALPELPSEGVWTVELLPPSAGSIPAGTEVSVFGTADDHAVRFTAGTKEKQLTAGENFHPQLQLFEEGRAVTNATVTATILKPGDDLGDLLARTAVPQLPAAHTESGSCADVKYAQLRSSNPGALEQFDRIERTTVPLNPDGQGGYSANFGGADVSGVYRIRYEIAYTSARLGEVRRMVEQTRYVGFPVPELNLSAIRRANGPDGVTTIRSTPAYRVNGQRRLIGPGFATAFGVTGQGVSLTTTDNCDGGYLLNVTGPPGQRFDLYLLDQEVFSGTVREFQRGDTRSGGGYLALRGGRTFPRGNFDKRFDSGLYGELGLGTRIGSLLGLEVVGGYYGFEPGYKILGGTAYLNLYLNGGGAGHLVIGAGPGYYFPDDEDARIGGSLRAALEREFGNLTLGVEGGYFRLSEPEQEFATLGLGLKIRL